MDIKWTDNWRRIKSLFIKVEKHKITIHSIGYQYTLKIPFENLEPFAEKIARALASQPVSNTEKIINQCMKKGG
jgi:arylamine N-acetyltransferase